jgi:hypothetical protein
MAWNVKNETPTGKRYCNQRQGQTERHGMKSARESLHEERVVLEDAERTQVSRHRQRADPAPRARVLRPVDQLGRAVIPERDPPEQ